MYQPFVATSMPAEQAFAAVHLPGRGAAVWTQPRHWQVHAILCTRGTAYHLHLAGIGPSAAVVVAQVAAAWTRTHAEQYRCQHTRASLVCHALLAPR